jgi:hypothetical protein
MRSHSKKPEVGDLVDWCGQIGVIKQSRGTNVQIHWMIPWLHANRLVDASWLRRSGPEIQVISRSCKKNEKSEKK